MPDTLGAGGTASPERAKRYLGADSGGAAKPGSPGLRSRRASGPSLVPPGSGFLNVPGAAPAHGGSGGSSRGDNESRRSSRSGWSDSAGGSGEGGSVEEGNHELGPGAKEWNHFQPHSTPGNGELWQHTRLGRRKGMAHPPRNPEVQKDLLEYLESCGVRSFIPRRSIKPRKVEEQGTPTGSPMLGGHMSRMTTIPSARSEAPSAGGRRSSSATQLKTAKGLQPWTLPWTPGVPLPHTESTGSRRGTKNNASSRDLRPAELWAQQCNPQVKDGSKPLPKSFDDLDQWGRELSVKTRHLGVDIDSRTVEDVSDLAMYHNGVSRKIEQHDAGAGCKLTHTMRSFSETMRLIQPHDGEDVAVDEFEDCLARQFRVAKNQSQGPDKFPRQSMSRQSMGATR